MTHPLIFLFTDLENSTPHWENFSNARLQVFIGSLK